MDEVRKTRSQPASKKKIQYEPNLKLRRERELKGWSQTVVAEKIGAQPNLLTRWETGSAFPCPFYRQKLCTLFEKDAESLGLIKNEQTDAAQDTVSPRDPLQHETLDHAEVVHGDTPGRKIDWQHGLSRRTILGILGAGGIVLAGALAESFWWHKDSAQPPPHASFPAHVLMNTVLYTYKTQPLEYINDVAWSPHGGYIVCAVGDSTAKVLDERAGTVVRVYRGHKSYINCAQWASDGLRIATGSADKTVHIWNAMTGSLQMKYMGHKQSVLYLAWSHDGTMIASGSRDGTVQVWDAFTGQRISTYTRHKGSVWSLRWSPDNGSIVSGGDDGIVHVWSANSAKPSVTFRYTGPASGGINEVDWSPDGKWILSAHANSNVYLWDALTGSHDFTYQGHTAAVRTARWSPTGKIIASGGVDDTVQIWDALTGKRLLEYLKQTNDILEVSWSPDATRLVSASKDYSMIVYAVSITKMG
ncbi:eIF2A-related protein [Dictyobacter arantiisoli]|uniref:HTH cro/C1-type domain-containing protein n=1 Tax=Dictyobacter arantiisoli TaxID=2014874 RepID=A0A5A5T7V5_9CHLR|nr:hypothetical protein [Dictyobacter arantiisoli]GCF07024.1 hypothetical protein KDI_05880 [Dictyobacter arantiisoli]